MTLNAGAGRCRADAQVSIRAATPVIELGAVADVLHAALNAAHHANRHADADDMLAVALPGLHMRRGQARPGHEVVLFGSERRLEAYLDLEGVATLRRRGMLVRPEIREAWMDEGETGTAYLRDRSVARRSPGTLRRAKARAERRGATFRKDAKAHDPDPSVLALHYGSAVVHVRPDEGPVSAEPLRVSTYGFSSAGSPAVLPIRCDPPLDEDADAE